MRLVLMTVLRLAVALGLLLATGSRPLFASTIVAYTDRGSFGANDLVDWGQVGLCIPDLPAPFTAVSAGGIGVSGSVANGATVNTTTQRHPDDSGGCPSYDGWFGNFAPDDNLIWTNNAGPLTLTFDRPVSGAGAQIMADFYGDFTAQLDAYSGATLLGSVVNLAGFSIGDADNSAIFLGLRDLDGAEITSVVFTVLSASIDPDDFAINQVSLDEVPEPATWALLGSGLTLVGLQRWRARRQG